MLKADIDKEIQELASEQAETIHPPDPEFDPSILNPATSSDATQSDETVSVLTPDFLQGATKFPKKTQEEIVIDELLLSVPRAQGYYLKLYKEIRPNELELKLRIDNYEMWADLEWELTKLVREYTKRSPDKWGTGKYKLVVWHDKGMRGQKRPPMDFYIDADESPKAAGSAQAVLEEQLSGLAKFTETLHRLNPPATPISPTDQLKIVAESMKTGQELTQAKNNGESSAMAAMMTAMVQMMQQSNQQMMTLFATMNQKKEDPLTTILLTKLFEDKAEKKNALGMIKELKDAGLIPKKEETGLAGELKSLTMLLDVARGLGGEGGEGGGALETLIKTLGPKVPEIVSNVTGTINKVVEFNRMKLNAIGGPPKLGSNPPKELDTTIKDESQIGEGDVNVLVKMFSTKLHTWVVNKNFDKFEDVSKAIRSLSNGQPLVEDAIKAGTMTKPDLVKFVTDFDKDHYLTDDEKKLLDEFVEEYIKHVKEQGTIFLAKCASCSTEYSYDSEQEFKDDKADGMKCEECDGELVAS